MPNRSTLDKHKRIESVGLTEAEWEALPVTFDAPTMARVILSNLRYVQNHAKELGGRKVAGRWVFTKTRTAELLGM